MGIFWTYISGGILSGKSSTIEKLIKILINKENIQLCGFYQPSYIENEEREGYNLYIIENEIKKIEKFALINYESKPGTIPYIFKEEGFIETFKNSEEFQFNSKPVICIIDEFGQLESFFQKGHYNTIINWINKIKKISNAIIILSFNIRRLDFIKEFMKKNEILELEYHLILPTLEENIYNFLQNIINKLN